MTDITSRPSKTKFSLNTKRAPDKTINKSLGLAGEDELIVEHNDSTAIESFDLEKRNEKVPEVARVIEGPQNTWGIHRRKRRRSESLEASEEDSSNGNKTAEGYGLLVSAPRKAVASAVPETKQLTETVKTNGHIDDAAEDAMDALLGRTSSRHVIAPPSPPPTEEELFHRDFRNAPPPATLQEYAATPVEGFGAALLRGQMPQGKSLEAYTSEWEARQPSNKKKPKGIEEDVKRGYRLGIGAKPSGLKAEEDDRRDGKRQKPQAFTGFAMKNKRTGEIISEEELATRRKTLEEGAMVSDREQSERKEGRDHKRHGDSNRSRRAIMNGDYDSQHRDGQRHVNKYDDGDHKYSRSRSHRDRREYSSDSDRQQSRRRDRSRRESSRDRYDKHRRRKYDGDEKDKRGGTFPDHGDRSEGRERKHR